MSRRVALTPCDYLYLIHHQILRRTVRSGSMAFMAVDVQGHPDPARVREILASVLAAHPVLAAPLRVSRLTGRPYWPVRPLTPAEAALAAERAYQFDDLRQAPDWPARLDALWQSRYVPDWDLTSGPQIRLDQYALPDGRTRFSLHWTHFVMDADGAQLFLTALAGERLPSSSAAADDPAPMIAPDGPPMDALAWVSLFRRLQLLRRGFTLNADCRGLEARPLFDDSRATLTTFGEAHRIWGGEQMRVIQSRAIEATPPGPAFLARYLAGCVLQALHRVYLYAGVKTDAYLITLPMRVNIRNPDGTIPRQRPIPGNYIVSPVICGRRTLIDDRKALAADILRQLEAYRRAEGDLVQWTMVWAASYLRASWYPLLFKMRLGFETLSSGFSYVRVTDYPGATIAGASIGQMHCGGPLATPPGWNPVFMRYRDGLSLSLTWNRPSVPDDAARRYIELIEREVLGSGSVSASPSAPSS